MSEDSKPESEVKVDSMCAVEYKMPQGLNLDDIENCWPQWQRFKLSFKNFVLAAGLEKLSEARKAAILINCIGQQAQELFFNVLKPEDNTKDKLEDVIKIFDAHFKPKQNEVINSYNLNKRNQEDGESFDVYYTAIKKLVENCNFGDQKDRRTQQKLLEVKDLTLDKAVEICRSAELSREFVKALNTPEVNTMRSARPEQYQQFNKAKYSSNNTTNNSQPHSSSVKETKVTLSFRCHTDTIH